MLGIETPGLDRRIRAALQRARQDPAYPIDRLLRATERYLTLLDEIAATDPEALRPHEAVSARIELRALAQRLLAPFSANATAREILDRFIAIQPASMPGEDGFDFRVNPAFPHAALWWEILAPIAGRPGLRFLEMGVAEGRATCWLLTHVLTHETSTITCADYFGSNEGRFDSNVRRAGGSGRVLKRQGNVRFTVCDEPPVSYDWVYVDAASQAADQQIDCLNAWRVLKPEGLIVIDDYGGPHDWEPGVRLGTDAFVADARDEMEVLHTGFQLIARKR